jgi:hypothetical protein
MIKLLLKLLNAITSQINQLPSKDSKKMVKQSPVNRSRNLSAKKTRPKSVKIKARDRKRKGPPHSEEMLYNRGP